MIDHQIAVDQRVKVAEHLVVVEGETMAGMAAML